MSRSEDLLNTVGVDLPVIQQDITNILYALAALNRKPVSNVSELNDLISAVKETYSLLTFVPSSLRSVKGGLLHMKQIGLSVNDLD